MSFSLLTPRHIRPISLVLFKRQHMHSKVYLNLKNYLHIRNPPNYLNNVKLRNRDLASVLLRKNVAQYSYNSLTPKFRTSNFKGFIKSANCYTKGSGSFHAFHTSPRNNAHPILLIALKQIAKLGAIATGRGFRKWWQSLPANKKAYIWQAIKEARVKIFVAGGVASVCAVGNYMSHLQETPVTHRKRYVAFTPDQFLKIAQFEYEGHMQQNQDTIVNTNHPFYRRIVNIAQRIVNSNQDIDLFQKQTWTVIVVDEPSQNAFVLPTGHIFVHTGLMQMVLNDDQLAFVISHEMAHAVLGHSAENLSFTQLIDWLVIVVMAAIWAFLPSDGIALITQWFFSKVVQLSLHLPYSRKLEMEADEVGLQFAAKACYDVRESSNFWNMMSIRAHQEDSEPIEWLSTHPTHDQRAEKLDSMMPKVLEMRTVCKCPPLRKQDPRLEIKALKQMVKDHTLIPLLGGEDQREIPPPAKTVPVIS